MGFGRGRGATSEGSCPVPRIGEERMGVHCVQLFFSCTITKQRVTWLSPAEHTVNTCFWNADRSQFGNARKGVMAGGLTGTNDTWRARPGWWRVYLPSVETSTQFGLYLLHSSIISTLTAILWSPLPNNCWKILIKLCIDLAQCHFFPKNGNRIIIWGLYSISLVKTQLRQINVISLRATMSLILNKCCFLPMITTP